MRDKIKIPKVEVKLNEEQTHYQIEGWSELDLWARRNSPLWNLVSERCRYSNISETDRLKLLCSVLLEESEQSRGLVLQYAERFGSGLSFHYDPFVR
jgi:hypothetical protein